MPHLRTLSLSSILLAALVNCGPSSDGTGNDQVPDLPDQDGDGIADVHEGKSQGVDTDNDGTPDYLDADSDGDGIPDAAEAGDDKTGTPPIDSDGDGTPDFRDLDSDGNGIDDGTATDTTDDLDGDGIGNWADLDDDGDTLTDVFEIDGTPASPPDADSDGTPNFQDLDSDGDDILDKDERASDPDMDGVPAYLDDDSDGDCRGDSLEAGDADLNTPPVDSDGDSFADFLDRDSDNDGLSDTAEDKNCNGLTDPSETSASEQDSDGDGVTDLVESAAGTDPLDQQDNPQANGDFVFLVPYEDSPSPGDDDLDFATELQSVDVYVLVDRSGSMSAEIASVRDNLAAAIEHLTCPPLGTGDPADCIPDIWSGSGTVGYDDAEPYENHVDMQPDPAVAGPMIPTNEPSGSFYYEEPLTAALFSSASGLGSADLPGACTPTVSWPARASCSGAPGGSNALGYPCFRPGALPVILLATDEAPSDSGTFSCPTIGAAASAVNSIGGKLVGIRGETTATSVTTDLDALATQTGAVDSLNGNAPLVFDGADSNAVNAIEDGIRTLANGVPLDISATPVDDPADGVDAVAEFVDHLETLQPGSPQCADGLTDQDTDGDGFPDLFVDVAPGTPVCWKLVAKMNHTVMPTSEPQLFKATVEVYGDDVTMLDSRDVYFLVPPDLSGPGVD